MGSSPDADAIPGVASKFSLLRCHSCDGVKLDSGECDGIFVNSANAAHAVVSLVVVASLSILLMNQKMIQMILIVNRILISGPVTNLVRL